MKQEISLPHSLGTEFYQYVEARLTAFLSRAGFQVGIVGLYRNGTQAWSIAPAFAPRFEARERPHNTTRRWRRSRRSAFVEDLDVTMVTRM